jgi:hypothetical protein
MEELRSLGYEFRDGCLVQVGTTKGFEFRDQEHYNSLADAVLRYVETLLVEEAGLTPIRLPLASDSGSVGNGPSCVIYASDGFETADKLLLFIQGSGRVRVGVWGCALCVNRNLSEGTMLPYLKKADAMGYGILVLNPNENDVEGQSILGSETPEAHVGYVWEHLVATRCCAPIVDVVAHSNGGRALLAFLARRDDVVAKALERLAHVVLTDSYHAPGQVRELSSQARALIQDPLRTINYVPHTAPIGTPVSEWSTLGHHMTKEQKGCECLSAAAPDHASTNYCAMDAAFAFFSG